MAGKNKKDREIDPTKNVIALTDAANKRQDDLRELTSYYEEKISEIRDEAQRRFSIVESRRIDAVILAESRRMDALMAAQANNVALASEKSAAQAATLATQVLSNAEALRNQVAATAATTNSTTAALRDSLEKRLTVVEQNQYQAGGAQTQRSEGQKTNQWVIGLVMSVFIAVVLFLLARMWPAAH